MFERFTERARQVIVNALDEARRAGQPWIGCEQVLAAIANMPESAAAKALADVGYEIGRVRMELGLVEAPDPGMPRQFRSPARRSGRCTAHATKPPLSTTTTSDPSIC